MSVASFNPTIWAASMLTDFRETAVAAALSNREYEGDASKGNTVKINTASAVTVFDYSIGEANGGTEGVPKPRTTAAESVDATAQDLLIDQEKNFDFYVDDIDKAQVAGSMDVYTRSAGEGLAEDSDTFLLALAVSSGTAVTDADITNPISEAANPGDAAMNVLRDLRKALNKAKVPKGQRVAFMNAEFEAVLLEASSKIMSVDTSGSSQGLREAMLGRLLGFDLYVTENMPVTNVAQVAAVYRPALAYVSQIDKTEGMRAQDKFADRLRGLHVYGAKVIRPTAIQTWTDVSA